MLDKSYTLISYNRHLDPPDLIIWSFLLVKFLEFNIVQKNLQYNQHTLESFITLTDLKLDIIKEKK